MWSMVRIRRLGFTIISDEPRSAGQLNRHGRISVERSLDTVAVTRTARKDPKKEDPLRGTFVLRGGRSNLGP